MDRSTQHVTQTTMLAQIKDRENRGAVAGTNRFRAGTIEVLQTFCTRMMVDPDSEIEVGEQEGQGR
jgi:hypothetical protein